MQTLTSNAVCIFESPFRTLKFWLNLTDMGQGNVCIDVDACLTTCGVHRHSGRPSWRVIEIHVETFRIEARGSTKRWILVYLRLLRHETSRSFHELNRHSYRHLISRGPGKRKFTPRGYVGGRRTFRVPTWQREDNRDVQSSTTCRRCTECFCVPYSGEP